MVLGDGSRISASLRKSHNRTLKNKLSRLGEVHFEHVRDIGKLTSMLNDFVSYKDFRNGAIANAFPFQMDSLKEPFHLALMKNQNLSIATVLKAGDINISITLGFYGKMNTIHHFFQSFNPFHAKLSPMSLHFLMLGMYLVKQGFSIIDLTPVSGGWKNRFATEHDEVKVLTIFPNRSGLVLLKTKRKFRSIAKRSLQLLRINLQSLNALFQKLRYKKMTVLLLDLFKSLWQKSELRVYLIKNEQVPKLDNPLPMSRDRIRELLLHRPTGNRQPRQTFMAQAKTRLELSNHFYTYTENNRLLFCGWLMKQPEKDFIKEFGQEFQFIPGSVCLFGFYLHPQSGGHDLIRSSLLQMLLDAVSMEKANQIYIVLSPEEKPLMQIAEKIGFVYDRTLIKKLSWGKIKHWSIKEEL